VQVINERFRFLSSLIEEVQIGGVLAIGRHAGGIKEELARWRRRLVFPVASAGPVGAGTACVACASAISWAMASLMVPKLER